MIRRMPRMLSLGLCLVLAGLARAQEAPAGNAHPKSDVVSDDASIAAPFGQPAESTATFAQKRALADAVDLAPLEGLAVFHGGRVKVLGTLARETVSAITGKRAYEEWSAGPDGVPAKSSFNPMFTLLDLVIDPGFYFERPLMHVEYLPLRREFLELAFPDDPASRERWLKLTRISPIMLATHGGALQGEYAFKDGYAQGFDQLERARRLWAMSGANMMLVSPPTTDAPYEHLSRLPPEHPARRAGAELGRAWRAGDAAGVNAAVRRLADELPRINPSTYPASRLGLERVYNRSHAFEFGLWVYLLSLVLLVLAFATGRRGLAWAGVGFLGLGAGLHAFGFVLRCLIAERFAIQNQFESMTGMSLFAVIVGSAIMLGRRQWLFGAASAGVGFLVLITATQAAIPGRTIEREAAILNTSVLLKYHVTTVLMSYGLITLGFMLSLFYLGSHYFSGWRARRADAPLPAVAAALAIEPGPAAGGSRALHDLDKAQLVVLQLAFWTLAVGIMLGAWWADHSWGRWWAFDPKETWALVTWIIYLIVIHVRLISGGNRGLRTAWLSVLGFVVMLWTYFGVNLLLPGLHAYA